MDPITPTQTEQQAAQVPQITVPGSASDPAPAPAPGQGDGVIDPPVADEEAAFVLDMLENFDKPSSEEVALEQKEQEQAAPVEQQLDPALSQQIPGQQQPGQVPGQQASPQQQQPGQAGTQPEQVVQQQIGQQQPGQVQQQPAQPQPVQGQGAAQAPAPEKAFEALRAQVEAQREQFIQVAAQSYEGTFTDQDVEEFQSEPKKALAKMGARLHFDIVQNTLGMISANLPRMVTGMIQAQQIHRQAEDSFYQENPDLREHGEKIKPMAQMYRQLNPTMPADEFKKNLAMLARMQLGLTQAASQQQPVQQQQQVQQQRAPAFRPAGSVVPAQPAPSPAPNGANPWATMDLILEADSQGRLDERF